MLKADRPLLLIAGLCGLVSALTTLILVVAPDFYPAPKGLEDRIALLGNGWYQLRMWTYFLHPLFTFVAALGVWSVVRERQPGLALLAILFFGVWAYTEAFQQAMSIVAVNWTWRANYLTADATTQALYRSHMDMFNALWDGMYLLLNVGFFLGNLFMAAAIRGIAGRVEKLLPAIFLLGACFAAMFTVSGYGGPAWLGAAAGASYPYLQPLARLIIGLWLLSLWRRPRTA